MDVFMIYSIVIFFFDGQLFWDVWFWHGGCTGDDTENGTEIHGTGWHRPQIRFTGENALILSKVPFKCTYLPHNLTQRGDESAHLSSPFLSGVDNWNKKIKLRVFLYFRVASGKRLRLKLQGEEVSESSISLPSLQEPVLWAQQAEVHFMGIIQVEPQDQAWQGHDFRN